MAVTYRASPTCWAFHKDNSFVRGLIGPIGSGKSVACCWEIFKRAQEQAPDPTDKVRRTRFAVIRNTYRELSDTTMETFFDWFPKTMGDWSASDMRFTMKFGMTDGTQVNCEVMFRALDRPDDVKKLLSLELTAAWVNEAREVPKAVIDMLQGRVGRYPSKRIGGPTWWGIFMDTNPPDTDHWWYTLFEEKKPKGWRIFHQPGAMSPNAENLDNLVTGYYENIMQGKDQEWVNVYVHGKYGFVKDGKPIYPEYNDEVHTSKIILPYRPGLDLWIGLDFGLTPAALFAQQIPSGQWQAIDELVTDDMGAAKFSKLLSQKIRMDFPESRGRLHIYGDPAGDTRAQTDEKTPYDILQANGIIASPAHTNDPLIRRDAVAGLLKRMDFAGQPALLVSPKARTFRKGMAGGYKLRRLQVVGDEKYADKPDKNMYSHVCEAGQYLFISAGEDNAVLGGSTSMKRVVKTAVARSRGIPRPRGIRR